MNARSILRFKQEFRALQEVNHPNLVTLGELVSEGETWFFSMELIRGEDFVSWCSALPSITSQDEPTIPAPITSARDRPGRPLYLGFDEKRLRAALAQLATGLSALHDAHKIDRDIKPSNVLVDAKGRVVILDFGLIADVDQEREADATTDAELVGTPSYMAPEQAASKPMNAAADWYAVGVLLYEVLTGDVPFTGPPLEVLQRKQTEEPRRPSSLSPGIPPDLDYLCMQLLQFDPNARPTGRQVLRSLGVMPERASGVSLPAGFHPRVDLRRARSRAGAAQQGVRELARGSMHDRPRSGRIGARQESIGSLLRRLDCDERLTGGHPGRAVLRARDGPLQGARRRHRRPRSFLDPPPRRRGGLLPPNAARRARSGVPRIAARPGDGADARPGEDG